MATNEDIQDPGLNETDRKKLDSIVQKMLANKESDDAIQFVVDDFKKKYSTETSIPKFDIATKPGQLREKKITESVSTPAKISRTEAAAATAEHQTSDQKFSKNIEESKKILQKELMENDDVIENLIRSNRGEQEQQEIAEKYLGSNRTDATGTALSQYAQSLMPDKIRAAEAPVSPDEIAIKKQELLSDPQAQRGLLQKVAEQKPDKAGDIKASVYILDANERGRNEKMLANYDRLKKGEYDYNAAVGGQVKKPEGFFDSILTGFGARTQQMQDYDFINDNDKQTVIDQMELERDSQDPDDPVPVSRGVNELAQMLGMEGIAMAKGGGAAAVTSMIPGGEVAAPFVSAAVTAPEYYKRGYSSAFKEVYNQLRNEKKTPEEAYETAIAQAKDEGKLSAAEGAISSAIGGRIGLKPLPKFNMTSGLKSALVNVLKQTAHVGGEAALEGTIDGLAAGYLQEKKNQAAAEKGIHREQGAGILENVKGELLFSLGMAGVTKAGRTALDPTTYKTLLHQIAKQPDEIVDAKLGEMIQEGQIAPDDAAQTKADIIEQRTVDSKIPEEVPEAKRMKIQEKMQERDELQKKADQVDEAFKPGLKEEIKKINEEITTLAEPEVEAPEEIEKPKKEAVPSKKETGKTREKEPATGAEKKSALKEAAPVEEKAEPVEETPAEKESEPAPIETEEDVERELAKLFSNEDITPDQETVAVSEGEQAAAIPEETKTGQPITFYHAGGKVKGDIVGKGEDGRLTVKSKDGTTYKVKAKDVMQEGETPTQHFERMKKKPLAKMADMNARVTKEDLGVAEAKTTGEVIDKLIEKNEEFTPLLQLMKRIPAMRKTKFETYESGKNKLLDEYFEELGVYPDRYGAMYIPKGFFNSTHESKFEPLNDTVVLSNSYNSYYDLTHEMTHILTRDAIPAWKKLVSGSDRKLIEDIFKYIKTKKGDVDTRNAEKYGLENIDEFLVEAIINPAFRKYVSDVNAGSKKEFLDVAQQGEARDFIVVLRELIEKLVRHILGKEQYAEGIEDAPLIDKAVELLTSFYLKGDQNIVSATEGSQPSIMEDFESMMPGGVLAIPARKPVLTQEDAVKKIIKKTPLTIPSPKLLEILEKGTQLPATTLKQWIDDIRKPPPPPTPTSALSPGDKNLSLRKFDNLKPAEKDAEKWYTKLWGTLKNMSAWLDNPYRFITKITEDINKQYSLGGKEVIPLGRAFEKSSAGAAALKTDAFINEVVRGNIEGEKLGRLKGEKYDDFQKYMAANRVIDRLNKQEEKLAAGEVVNRQTGNITKQDAEVQLEELDKKYGPAGISDFRKRAGAFQVHMDLMLQNLVASGILSEDAYADIKADNDFYAPFSVVQEKVLADQQKQPVGISGVVKRIKGVGYDLPTTKDASIGLLNDLADALTSGKISPEEYFNTSLGVLENAKQAGQIDEATYDKYVAALANPGFAIHGIIDAAANMIYRSEGMAMKNNMMQRLYAYKAQDTEGLFIQDVDGFTPMTLPDGSVRMVPKPLGAIKVNEGMAPVKLRLKGKDKIVAINKYAANKLNNMNNFEQAGWMKGVDMINKVFRFFVITTSPGFQAVNFVIDFVRTTMLSRYGLLAGKGLLQPMVNAILYIPQYIEALAHSTAGNLGKKTGAYKQWMESPSFSRGMYDNLFDNEKKVKEINASAAKRILTNFLKLKFVEVPGSILEQTHKLVTHQRASSVEGMDTKMATTMLATFFNQNIKVNMNEQELQDAMDRLNYEVQNFAGSPNFPQTHKILKIASVFLQFFSARVKGEMTDYRRVGNLFTGKGEGVKLSAGERAKMLMQFTSIAGVIAAYAVKNNEDDEDEKEFASIPSYHRDNYLNIPAGEFEFEDADGNKSIRREFIKIPLRGLTATMNVTANSFVKYMKSNDPEELKKAGLNFAANASPVNLHGKDSQEIGESMVSNLTPVFKYFLEYSFNRDTHAHRDLIPSSFGKNSMAEKYRRGDIDPWEVVTDKTPEWAIEFSKFLYDELGISASPIMLDHMENTMGNPTELYNQSIMKRFKRSQMRYPVVEPKE